MHWTEKLKNPGLDPLIMGILNVTPDSFSDGGRFRQKDAIRFRIEQMVLAGVDLLDIGGESTRPGASFVSVDEELDRVLPAIEIARTEFSVPVSVDTYKTEVMGASIELGVDMINDVNALQAKGALELLSNSDAYVCLMHKQGTPETMQASPVYQDVVADVMGFLSDRARRCENSGIERKRIVLDPGFGFGKTLQHNVELFTHLEKILSLGYPLLVGVSRKRMIGELLGDRPVDDRVIGSVTAAVLSAQKGAKIIRVHDVPETIQAIEIMKSLS